jgi:hypothetical protein
MKVNRRRFLPIVLLAAPAFAFEDEGVSVQGELTATPDGRAALRTADGKLIYLEGDKATVGVLHDARLKGTQFEALGHLIAPDRFEILPIHKRAMFVHKDGKRLMVTYWCDVCGIRSYTPGPCWCCQQETELDLRDKL